MAIRLTEVGKFFLSHHPADQLFTKVFTKPILYKIPKRNPSV